MSRDRNTNFRNFALTLLVLANGAGAVVPVTWWLLNAQLGPIMWDKVVEYYCGLCWVNFFYLVPRLFENARNS